MVPRRGKPTVNLLVYFISNRFWLYWYLILVIVFAWGTAQYSCPRVSAVLDSLNSRTEIICTYIFNHFFLQITAHGLVTALYRLWECVVSEPIQILSLSVSLSVALWNDYGSTLFKLVRWHRTWRTTQTQYFSSFSIFYAHIIPLTTKRWQQITMTRQNSWFYKRKIGFALVVSTDIYRATYNYSNNEWK